MSKIIKTDFEAKLALRAGVNKVANAVKVTLGPAGKTVIIDQAYGGPTITDDGVTVAKDFQLEDKFENVGASLIQEVANKTNEEAGDGTSTAIVLAQSMLNEAFASSIFLPGQVNEIKRGMEKAVAFVVEKLQKMKKDVKTKAEIAQVATIASLDPEVGTMLAEIMEEVGKDGIITVEEGHSAVLEKEVVKGTKVDRGYLTPHMVNNPNRMEAVWDNPAILVTDQKIASNQDIIGLFDSVMRSGQKNLVIFADDVMGEALATIVVNKLRGIFNTLVIKISGTGEQQKAMLEDLAILTGAYFVTAETGMKISNLTMGELGKARRVLATKDHTIIVDGGGDKDKVEERITQIKAQIEASVGDYEKTKLKERLAKLTGGVGVIKVGGFTETEIKAKRYKIEDALHATKAAVQEGIIPGGGAPLARIAPLLDKYTDTGAKTWGEKLGFRIIRESLEAPLKQIAINVGAEPMRIIMELQNSDNDYIGYDFSRFDPTNWRAGFCEDMMKAGIVDPLKVTRLALEHAASIASTLVTSEAILVDKPEPEKAPQN